MVQYETLSKKLHSDSVLEMVNTEENVSGNIRITALYVSSE